MGPCLMILLLQATARARVNSRSKKGENGEREDRGRFCAPITIVFVLLMSGLVGEENAF